MNNQNFMNNQNNLNMMNPMMMQQNLNMMNPLLMQQNMMMMQQNAQNMMNQANMMNQVMNQSINQQQQQQNNINSNQAQTEDPNNITVSFKLQIREGPPKDPIAIQCNLNDKVSTIIKAYRNKTQDFDEEHEKFIYNAKRLNETLTCAEAGILNNSVVFVLNDGGAYGGY